MSGRRKRFACTVGARRVVAAAVTAASRARTAVAAKQARRHAQHHGLRHAGDDVAKTRCAIASKAVGGTRQPTRAAASTTSSSSPRSRRATCPDLVYIDRDKVGDVRRQGRAPAAHLVHQVAEDQHEAVPVRRRVNEVTYKGKIYGIPEFYDVRTIIVDNDVARRGRRQALRARTRRTGRGCSRPRRSSSRSTAAR